MTTKLFVGNLNKHTSAVTLGHLFENVGPVTTAEIITGEDKNISLGWGFVTMETPELAQQAIEKLNGTVLEGSTIRVAVARDNTATARFDGRPRRGQYPRDGYRGSYREDFAPRRPYRGRGYGGYGYFGGYGGYGYDGYYDAPYYRHPANRRPYGYQSYPPYYNYRRGGRGGFGRRPQKQDASAPKSATQIHIGSLPYTLKKEELEEALREFKVKEVILSRDIFNTTRNRGYAFVELETPEESQRILAEYPSIRIKDRVCPISPAFERPVKDTAADASADGKDGEEKASQ